MKHQQLPTPVARWLRLKDAAAYAGVSPSTFEGWGLTRHVPAGEKHGRPGVVLYDIREIDRWLESSSSHGSR